MGICLGKPVPLSIQQVHRVIGGVNGAEKKEKELKSSEAGGRKRLEGEQAEGKERKKEAGGGGGTESERVS